ncbi:MAG: hypothetical protein Q6J68_05625, partial [Thermostichales cyanobacterium SZTDM-1c_bins_54]
MWGKLRSFNQLLNYQLAALHLFGQARRQGSRIQIRIEYMRGDTVNVPELQALLVNLVTAAQLPEQDFLVQLICRQTGEITWQERLHLEPEQVLVAPTLDRKALLRQDYPFWRVSFFVFVVLLTTIALLSQRWSLGIPIGLGLVLGLGFPQLKRSLVGFRDLWLRLGLGVAGLTCGGIALWMLVVNGQISLVPAALLLLSGWALLG